mgnify:FL=1|tara:strand:- start:10374 stop:10619 length:246 start_codon:yes stop_codon:yes gene_type:complete
MDSSARMAGGNARSITGFPVQRLGQPGIERDLVKNPLPPMSLQNLVGVHGSHEDGRARLQRHLALSHKLIAALQQDEVEEV